jgi:HrpA-like RNA helicase
MGAISLDNKITEIGKNMTMVPACAEISRMLVASTENNCEWMVCSLAAILTGIKKINLLSVQNINLIN